MVSDIVLYSEVIGYWSIFALTFRRQISIVPTIPFAPIGLVCLGLALNHWLWIWCGTIIIFAVQMVTLVVGIWCWLKQK